LSRLGDADRARIAASGRLRSLRAGERLFEEGEPGRTAYVVVSGTIALLRAVPDGRSVTVALRTAGEWIGELALLDGGERSATAVADAPARVFELSSRAFASLLRRHPRVSVDLAAAIGRRLRQSDAALVEALTKRLHTLGAENRRLRREAARREGVELAEQVDFHPGASAEAERVRRAVRAAARSTAPVLVLGEPGTGKETVARAIHARSARAGKPFVKVDCALFAASALEARLFGPPSRGRGARESSGDALADADGGTLYLASIDRLPAWLQDRILHFRETGGYHRIGESRVRRSSARLIAGSTEDLEAAAREGKLRSDLLAAVDFHAIRLAPLRERPADLPALVASLLSHADPEGDPVRFSPSALRALARQPFPGNLRELRALLERLLEEHEGDAAVTGSDVARALAPSEVDWPERYAEALTAFKIHVVNAALERSGGNQAEASRLLGVHPSNLIRLMRTLGIRSER
jgi:DNA-binding NtrC family response regulator